MSDSKSTVHTRAEIERQLRMRQTPRTDNRNALLDLGFTPAYPHLARDMYYGAIWTRAIDAHDGSIARRGSHTRTLVMERAFHVRAERTRRMRLRRAGSCAAITRDRRRYCPLGAGEFTGVLRVKPAGDVCRRRSSIMLNQGRT